MRVVIEEDRVLRLAQVLLDPAAPPERYAAFADYNTHDLPDFRGWCEALRQSVPNLFPANVQLVTSQAELQAGLPDAGVLIVESLTVGEAELALAPQLRVVQQFGTQVDNIDREACRRRNVPVRTLRRRTNISVAEHTLAMLLALAKRIPFLNGTVSEARMRAAGLPFRPFDRRHTAASNYVRAPGIGMLHGATLGLLGFGEIASEVAAMARPFGARMLYHKRTRLTAEEEAAAGVAYCSFDALFREADYLSVHVPMEDATRGLVGANQFALMKPGAAIVNTSRAEIIDRAALLGALQGGRLRGAALDVHYQEPMRDDDPLLGMPNVILMPHTGGGSRLNGLADMVEMLQGIQADLRR